jgi:LytR cell envelope-related transcriptional attenuator
MSTPEEVKRARTQRLRRKHERQALIFGILIAALAVSGLGAAAIYAGVIDAPFNRDFTAQESKRDKVTAQPCIPTDTLPVPYTDIKVNVYNATTTTGLATTVSSALGSRDFKIDKTGNSTEMLAEVRISFGAAGLAAAYTVAAQFDSANFFYDNREDATVDVILGESFDALVAPEAVPLVSDIPMTSVESCVALDQITAEPFNSQTPEPTDASTDTPTTDAPAEG